MADINFDAAFKALTGNDPFPWQRALYEKHFAKGDIPASCNLPTGLGKTSVIAVWLIALANHRDKMPRRLVYVVNRRTVVDQTTDEVEGYARLLAHGRPPLLPVLINLSTTLRAMCANQASFPLAISTLRGQFADNREWSADPSRPAVICGTVDMIGSRLMFSGYGRGFKTRPLHAGFLGQDALIVHDEAHLEPAFQELLIAIEKEQKRCNDFRPLKVMELTATSRAGDEKPFELTEEEMKPPATLPEPAEPIHHVWHRLKAKKGLQFHPAKRGDVAKRIGELARDRKPAGKSVLVFVRTIDDVKTVQDTLTDKRNGGVEKEQVQSLTGTLRGLERDRLAKEDQVFARFLNDPKVEPKKDTVYLVCTSAGEVGVDISADDMVCDLSTLDSMAQRLGRVNRRGTGAASVDVVYESDPDPKPKSPQLEAARWKTKAILERLPTCAWCDRPHEASPLELRNLFTAEDEQKRKDLDEERKAAFAPTPTILPTSDILFDAWALTTIRDRLPGRPHVEPYLHGIRAWEPPETHVAWREEVWELPLLYRSAEERFQLAPEERKQLARFAEELLEDYPLKPHELLRDRSDRVFKHLATVASRHPDAYAWLVDDEGGVEVCTLKELTDKDEKDQINRRTVLLAPDVGGLREGLLDGSAPGAVGLDVADEWFADKEKKAPRRLRVWGEAREIDSRVETMRQIRRIDFPTSEEDEEGRAWFWFELPQGGDSEGSKSNKLPVSWITHTTDVVNNTKPIVSKLLPEFAELYRIAAECHDLGKKRKVFQTVLGNGKYPDVMLAKSGKKGGRVEERYRHEFGSLLDTENREQNAKFAEFDALSDEEKSLVLHLIAAHHGRGRPHFPADEAFDPEPNGRDAEKVAREVPQRFARLQRKYGRWGLAYLESLLRAADYAASASPSKFEEAE